MATVTAGYNWVSGETVTPAKLNSAAAPTVALTAEERTPAGAVMAFAMNSAPTGWLAADGTAVSRTDYAALFTAIGTTYGAGDGSTTFALPDLRGYFVRGSGTNSDGTAAGTFGAKQADELKAHTHTLLGANNTTGAGLQITRMADNMSNFQSGSFGGTETRPKNIAMLYCIKH